jgi:hypothetical protein
VTPLHQRSGSGQAYRPTLVQRPSDTIGCLRMTVPAIMDERMERVRLDSAKAKASACVTRSIRRLLGVLCTVHEHQ